MNVCFGVADALVFVAFGILVGLTIASIIFLAVRNK